MAITIYRDPNDEVQKHLVERGVEQKSYPRQLFTYMPIDNMDRIEPIFNNCVLWFSKPNTFNDPFDCKINPIMPSKKELADYLSEKYKIRNDELQGAIKKINVEEKTKKAIDTALNNHGIKCFTPDQTNLLMWSHYANSHTGICLEFDVLEDSAFFVYPIKVKYENEYPQKTFISGKEFTNVLLSTKFEKWSYENELRVYKMNPGYNQFKADALISVTFGCKASKDKVRHVIDVIKKNPELQHVRFYQAKADDKEYKLNLEEI